MSVSRMKRFSNHKTERSNLTLNKFGKLIFNLLHHKFLNMISCEHSLTMTSSNHFDQIICVCNLKYIIPS